MPPEQPSELPSTGLAVCAQRIQGMEEGHEGAFDTAGVDGRGSHQTRQHQVVHDGSVKQRAKVGNLSHTQHTLSSIYSSYLHMHTMHASPHTHTLTHKCKHTYTHTCIYTHTNTVIIKSYCSKPKIIKSYCTEPNNKTYPPHSPITEKHTSAFLLIWMRKSPFFMG